MHNNSTEDVDLTVNNDNLNNSNSNINIKNYDYNNKYINNNYNNDKHNHFPNNTNNENKNEKEKIINLIEKLKAEHKREKNKNNKLIAEFNIILIEKKKLEKIFMDCVEDSRREILQRKQRETVNTTKSGFLGSFGTNKKLANFALPTISEIKFENFQQTDKRRLLEAFLMKDEVINFIRENLSSNSDNNMNFGNINAGGFSGINNNYGNKGGYFAKNTMNEGVFTFRQTMLKGEVAKFGFDDFAKSKNSLRSSSKNLNFHK
jgi:hypothetical protein